MKIQNLAVIFIIIMLPISLVLTSYVQNQVQTVELQISYDTKLTNATYDAVKAFQLNTVNSSTSDLANSKIRDIEASVNTFFNSIANNFNMAGYNKDILQNYVPALVYTMYDGYYIYTPFTNTLSEEDEGATYQDGEKIYGLKPYVFYSCRYKNGSSTDVVITYSLDNYITVQGKVGDEEVYRAGYLLDNITESGDRVWYRGSEIETENNLTEQLALYENSTDSVATKRTYNYVKINGVKYYEDPNTGQWFSMLNGERYDQSRKFKTENDSAKKYYQEAYEFTSWVRSKLGSLTTSDAVDENGNSLADEFGNNREIFGTDQGSADSIEDENSLFNQHRQAVIRYAIEKNLSIAIANYNRYASTTSANFQMPELREDEWEKIINNVSIISFMQGLSIGGKIYNGYSIVTNTKTEEVVNLDSIYITTSDGQYHRATDADLTTSSNITGAFFNVDFERKSVTNGNSTTYYYPHEQTGCYTSIVSQSNLNDTDNVYEYMEEQGGTLAKMYFTVLGRERYSMYKTFNNSEVLLNAFTQ